MLSDVRARRIKPGDKPLPVGGTTGLILRPGSSSGNGKLVLRFVSPETGKRRDMGLGSYPEIGLADARRLAMQAREQIARGVDPIEQRERERAEKEALSRRPTFEQAAENYYLAIAPGFRNAKHRDQWITTLRTYAFPFVGRARVDTLAVADFARLLAPIWLTMPESAGRIKQRCYKVMNWCLAKGYVPANPVAAVEALLPKQPAKSKRVAHHPAVPWRDLPNVIAGLVNAPHTVGRDALLFLILTAARSGEVRGATWAEIDRDAGVWTIPASRMKTKVIHRVPLSAAAQQVLKTREQFRDEGDLIFTGRPGKPISDMTMTKLLRDAAIPSDAPGRTATAHGFRSSFRDWASENGYPRDLAERALAHAVKNATEAAYHRTDQLQARVAMMAAWAGFVVSGVERLP